MGEISTSKHGVEKSGFADFFTSLGRMIGSQSDNLVRSTDADLEKTAIGRSTFRRYYAIRDGNVVDVGFELGDDVTRQEHDNVGRYALLVLRSSDEVEASLLDESVSTEEAHDQAINLIENNRNNVVTAEVLVGVPFTFASRPVFQSLSSFFRISKEDVNKRVHESSDEDDERKKKRKRKERTTKGVPLSDTAPFDLHCKFNKSQPRLSEGLVFGIVYSPNDIDTAGDYASAEDIQRACHDFLPNAMLNLHHDENGDLTKHEAVPVESYIAPCDFEYVPGNPDTKVTKGSWVLVTKVFSEAMRNDIESGEFTGYSMEGAARRVA